MRFPRHTNLVKILFGQRVGGSAEQAIVFTGLLVALGIKCRICKDLVSRRAWTEFWDDESDKWVHVDVAYQIFDNPLVYEKEWE